MSKEQHMETGRKFTNLARIFLIFILVIVVLIESAILNFIVYFKYDRTLVFSDVSLNGTEVEVYEVDHPLYFYPEDVRAELIIKVNGKKKANVTLDHNYNVYCKTDDENYYKLTFGYGDDVIFESDFSQITTTGNGFVRFDLK